MNYLTASESERKQELRSLLEKFNEIQKMGLNLDMSRGKPEKAQLDLCRNMMTSLDAPEDFLTESGFDVRNYGLGDGIPELKKLFAELLDTTPEHVYIGSNSSLNMMYNLLADGLLTGFCDSPRPWAKEEKICFLCPAPGYDRHFALAQHLGFELIYIPMTPTGPDMDAVESAVKNDASVKGIWCVPKYSNPTGITYSDDTVRRLAKMDTAAPDFRIFWDNAYLFHDLYEEGDTLLDLRKTAAACGHENRVWEFVSTSKITLAGAGVSAIAASEENIRWMKQSLALEGLGFDKVNQLRHARYLKNPENVRAIMKRHAAILRPKFEDVLNVFRNDFGDSGFASYSAPKGGYFISLNVMPGTAARTWHLAKDLGVSLTKVGATFPYGLDPNDENLRIAPSFVPAGNVAPIAHYIVLCAKIAALEKLLG